MYRFIVEIPTKRPVRITISRADVTTQARANELAFELASDYANEGIAIKQVPEGEPWPDAVVRTGPRSHRARKPGAQYSDERRSINGTDFVLVSDGRSKLYYRCVPVALYIMGKRKGLKRPTAAQRRSASAYLNLTER